MFVTILPGVASVPAWCLGTLIITELSLLYSKLNLRFAKPFVYLFRFLSHPTLETRLGAVYSY